MNRFAKIVVAFDLCILNAVVYGIVLAVLWGWFISPTFKLPPLPFLPAAGTVVIARLLVSRGSAPTPEETNFLEEAFDFNPQKLGRFLGSFLFRPLLSFFVGAVIRGMQFLF
ncbi:MAG: hypothetical protein A2365_02390 [Candidatus Nealsonbacteria bacterium RIFOXYB1_FULL_40_15]|uniref:Uncharacterized protein n=2 Tax=Candidatus Nealsoniibacteriota TaxID=1817911 RepID=A0A1G2EQU7_9BACT|nr:MAG: hypothetical protein A2365_02390 [Candidatus Nealsonbacteria bacterium RIFOXYB1_FULL_40_15]OGZ27638.1 MAG: hypothetical protein A2427_02715 [Candidatus Nealsonbacteria bacterium RIFOXYC1_FULL_40_7]